MKLSYEGWGEACEGAWQAVKNCCCGEEDEEEEEPLTRSQEKTKAGLLANEGRQGSRPYLACSVGRATNPVPCITLDKWEKPKAVEEAVAAVRPRRRVGTILRSKREKEEGTTRTVVVRRRHQSDSDEDSDASMASPVVARKSKTETLSSTIQEAEEEEEEELEEQEEDEEDEKVVGQEKQFLKTSSLASLLPRSESSLSLLSLCEGSFGNIQVRGDLQFGFIYNTSSGSLDVNIRQCRGLAAVDTKRNRSDTYVKVYLLPDHTKAGKRKTRVKKHTLSPVFDEMLRFVMPLKIIRQRTMWLSVWHSDIFGRNEFLGEVMLGLADQKFDNPSSRWHSLQDRV